MSNSMVQKQKFSVAITTDGYKNLIKNTLGDPDRAKRFVAAITSAVATNKDLQDCDAGTILAGGLLGESLNLSPSPQLGHYYLVPFKEKAKDKNGKVMLDANKEPIVNKKATFVLGYKGYLQLALRSGIYRDIDVMEIKQGEYLGRHSETGKPMFKFVEDDDVRESLPTIGYMAYFEYTNGFRKTLYWSKEKMLDHADKYSPSFSKKSFEDLQNGKIADKDKWKYSSFWYTGFDGMAKKTMLRQLISKWGVMSVEMQTAYTADSNEVGFNESNEITVIPHEEVKEEAPLAVEIPKEAEEIDINTL